MTLKLQTKLLVVGGGPGGYVAAIRAGQLGLDTVLVEEGALGGACLNRGCIPSKSLIHVASMAHGMTHAAEAGGRFGLHLAAPPTIDFAQTIAWKDGVVAKLNGGVGALLKRAKVKVIQGRAVFSDAKTCRIGDGADAIEIRAEHVVLATGSRPLELPFLPFGGPVISSTEALSLPEVPGRLVVVGGGYIGLELGIAYRKLGAEVTIVEAQAQILPAYDAALTEPVRKWLLANGVKLHLSAKALGLAEAGLRIAGADDAEQVLPADAILVAVGRVPNTEGWGLDTMAVDMAGPFVKIDGQCRTSMKDVWAIGDLTGEPMLAHRASAQGEAVAEIIAGHRRKFDPVCIPAVCFTEPEIVTVGVSPQEAEARGWDVIVGQVPLASNGRALSLDAGADGGFVRIIANKGDHRVLGVQAVGQHIAELSGEFALAIEMGAVLEDVAGAIHAHPSLGEVFFEASLKALGQAIHA